MSILWFLILLVYVQGVPLTSNDQIRNTSHVDNFLLDENKKIIFFNDPKIRFKFDDSLDKAVIPEIMNSMEYLREFSCLEFENMADVENSKNTYFLHFIPGSDSSQGDCWGYSKPKNVAPDDVTIGVNKGCDKGTITRLILRGLGFIDEHRRLDRDEYVQIFQNNTKLNEIVYKKLFSKQENDNRANNYAFPYDYNSITHLSSYEYAINSTQPTIIAKGDREVIFQSEYNRTLSVMDVVKINAAYNCFNATPWKFSPTRINMTLNIIVNPDNKENFSHKSEVENDTELNNEV